MRLKLLSGAAAGLLLLATTGAFASPQVAVSVKPVHALVAAVMEGVGTPSLIVKGAASAHTYALKPSDAATLQEADVIFWVGHSFEAFLDKPLEALGEKARIVALEDAPGLIRLPFREGGAFEAHDDGDAAEAGHAHEDHDAHDHEGGIDAHLWLDPANAKAMAEEIRRALTEADPANAVRYEKNARTLETKIDALTGEIEAAVAPVKDKPFIVFHDAYQYFEKRFGLRVAGSVTVSPETAPGAARVSEIHAKVESLGATCVFAEPQFEPKILSVVTEGLPVKSGTLDPEGGALEEGPDLYFQLMRNLAGALTACLT